MRHLFQLHVYGLHLSDVWVGLGQVEQLLKETEHHRAVAIGLFRLHDDAPHLFHPVLCRGLGIEQDGMIDRVSRNLVALTDIVMAQHLLGAEVGGILAHHLHQHVVGLILVVSHQQRIGIKGAIGGVVGIVV